MGKKKKGERRKRKKRGKGEEGKVSRCQCKGGMLAVEEVEMVEMVVEERNRYVCFLVFWLCILKLYSVIKGFYKSNY